MPEQRQITVRRAPKYVPFLVTGGVLGIIAAAIVSFSAPAPQDYTQESVFGYFMVLFAGAGVLVGAVAALVLDRISLRRAQRATVEEVEEGAEAQPDGAHDAASPSPAGPAPEGSPAGPAAADSPHAHDAASPTPEDPRPGRADTTPDTHE
ncbi:hypothetical protein [Sinomonas halotolerans]|uniref:Potassium transporter Trk n=1 Tax=Sinomonas halotolerans TaxID=1644133 RepID=A0ABU9X1C2_9MICC